MHRGADRHRPRRHQQRRDRRRIRGEHVRERARHRGRSRRHGVRAEQVACRVRQTRRGTGEVRGVTAEVGRAQHLGQVHRLTAEHIQRRRGRRRIRRCRRRRAGSLRPCRQQIRRVTRPGIRPRLLQRQRRTRLRIRERTDDRLARVDPDRRHPRRDIPRGVRPATGAHQARQREPGLVRGRLGDHSALADRQPRSTPACSTTSGRHRHRV